MGHGPEFNGYPYQPGERGIPFDELLARVEDGKWKGIFTSGSGRTLHYIITSRTISIQEDDQYWLNAFADEGNVTFDLLTNRKRITPSGEERREPHPDMYAKEFIRFSLKHYEDCGIYIQGIQSIWEHPSNNYSDNYTKFMKEYALHHDKVNAAKVTWSGRTFASFGFSQLREVDVVMGDYLGKPYVSAYFSKPQESR